MDSTASDEKIIDDAVRLALNKGLRLSPERIGAYAQHDCFRSLTTLYRQAKEAGFTKPSGEAYVDAAKSCLELIKQFDLHHRFKSGLNALHHFEAELVVYFATTPLPADASKQTA